ncbi:hypothetical protein [Dictyobacter arantiisoli]|uniref:Uncharacterized protein n=1 Tax=Dictyobacter arantiisoli TaxID=2014874 RepID=A0A5A5TK57_9CHLR|nr:hypothetical protein [Dictyobacter arantiisoli]GCF11274.1 hypothetical protein KDI_48380 [Dictyobacter arantiisoli]
MRKQYLRWILPVLVLLIMATVLILGPSFAGHAAGTKTVSPTPIPTVTAPGSKVKPDWAFYN